MLMLIVSGCVGDNENQNAADVQGTMADEVVTDDPYVIANVDFSNLQLAEMNKPVYDKYGVWERQEQELPRTIPALKPYDKKSVVYLTFNDGPDEAVTPAILDILKAEGIPATFYVLGSMAEQNPEIVKRIFDEGHAIGNNTYNSAFSEIYSSPWHFVEQCIKTDDIITSIIGMRPLIIRAPGGARGAFNQDYWDMVTACGYVNHDWNVSVKDSTDENPNASTRINNVINQLGSRPPKDVIIMMQSRVGEEETVAALPVLIHMLKDWGYSFGVVTPMTPQVGG